jgi:two-component system LytT family sensor kinase
LILRGFVDWYANIKLIEDLRKKNYETELALVKSQISPHFLFNTLNNIDVLIAKDATKASEYLNKLSDIMRFMLYETKTENIPMTKELSYIEKYIDLQKIRSANPDYVNYRVVGRPSPQLSIPPMLFIPFIENAFKHTESNKAESTIKINIEIEKDKIIFLCQNSYKKANEAHVGDNGLGNGLIKRRLDLLYPNNHTLVVDHGPDTYKVTLIITDYGN